MLVELFELVNRSLTFFLMQIINIIMFFVNFQKYRKQKGCSFAGALIRSLAIFIGVILATYIAALIIYLISTTSITLLIIIIVLALFVFI